MPALDGFAAACERALQKPLSGPPLSSMLKPNSRVAVVVDDLSLPVPPIFREPRRDMLRAVLRILGNHGVRGTHAAIVVANGLSRKWRTRELAEAFGADVAAEYQPRSHDAEDGSALARLADD